MKKLMTLALLATVGIASAASIDWSINMGRNGKVTDSEDNVLASKPIYLILASDAEALVDAIDEDKFADTLDSIKLDSSTLTSGGKWDGKDDQTATDLTNKKLKVGTEYDFAVVVYDAAHEMYYVSKSVSQTAYDEGAENPVKKGVTFQTTDLGSTYNPDWLSTKPAEEPPTPAVPEPATGALALAGVALLFRRRRA